MVVILFRLFRLTTLTALCLWVNYSTLLAQISNSEAIKLCRAGNTDDAIAEYRRLIANWPDSDCLWSNLAICTINRGRLDVAEEALKKLESLRSDSHNFHRAMGEFAYKKGRYEEAKRHLLRANEIEPHGREYYLLGRNAIKMNEDDFPFWRLATEYYRKESHNSGFSVKEWRDYGAAAYSAHLFDEAYRAYQRSLDIEPAHEKSKKFASMAKERILSGEKERLSIVVLVDKSRSMSDAIDYTKLKSSLLTALNYLDDDDYISVMGFDSSPFLTIALTKYGDIKDALKKRVMLLFPAGKSRLLPAFDEAHHLLIPAKTPRKHIVLITDGRISETPQNLFLDMIKQTKFSGITFSVVKVGNNKPELDFEALTKAVNGRFTNAVDIRHLTGAIYDDINAASRL